MSHHLLKTVTLRAGKVGQTCRGPATLCGHIGRPRLVTEHGLQGPEPSFHSKHCGKHSTKVIPVNLATPAAVFYIPRGICVHGMGRNTRASQRCAVLSGLEACLVLSQEALHTLRPSLSSPASATARGHNFPKLHKL